MRAHRLLVAVLVVFVGAVLPAACAEGLLDAEKSSEVTP